MELSRTAAPNAKLAQVFPGFVEPLDTVVPSVSDPDIAFGVNVDGFGMTELPVAQAF